MFNPMHDPRLRPLLKDGLPTCPKPDCGNILTMSKNGVDPKGPRRVLGFASDYYLGTHPQINAHARRASGRDKPQTHTHKQQPSSHEHKKSTPIENKHKEQHTPVSHGKLTHMVVRKKKSNTRTHTNARA
eukprot:GDKI01010288.1.p2 GENE.GDKI01010288.1~~GDKI01010288.1.p2  ORF type:complete len:130 (-),score=10.93 GDKI01010288.1:343-732(-)